MLVSHAGITIVEWSGLKYIDELNTFDGYIKVHSATCETREDG
jgi:hypothetical protein